MDVTFFETPEAMRAWLDEHHAEATELWIGFYKKGTGKPSLTWPESVAEALCYGWIDGIRKSIDDESYKIRFTPRKPRSVWSAVNVRLVEELEKQGRMKPAGRKAFEALQKDRSKIYAYEQRNPDLEGEYAKKLKANKAALAYWNAQTTSYRKSTSWWIMSAKREETREKRFAELIACSEAGRPVPPYSHLEKKAKRA